MFRTTQESRKREECKENGLDKGKVTGERKVRRERYIVEKTELRGTKWEKEKESEKDGRKKRWTKHEHEKEDKESS